MSVDKSLKSKTVLTRPRSVLTRLERIESLEEYGRWKEGMSVFGLPKVRTFRPKRRKKAAAKKEAAPAPGAQAAAAPAAAAPKATAASKAPKA